MARDINLTSKQWNDIIFEGKNKDYGAYEMRQSSSKRHVIALFSVLVLALLVAVLPALADKVVDWIQRGDGLTTEVEFTNLDRLNEKIEELDEIVKETAPPEPPLKSTIAFVAPEIVDQSQITDDNEMKTQEELTKSNLQISVATIEGTDDKIGIDIADLLQHQKIADEESKKVYDFVEVNPSYPGGEGDLDKYLRDNIIYPKVARELGIEGTVIIHFVVNKNGAITDVTAQRSPHKSLSDEAIRVVKAMPKWVPGKQNGKAVNVNFVLPIVFKLY